MKVEQETNSEVQQADAIPNVGQAASAPSAASSPTPTTTQTQQKPADPKEPYKGPRERVPKSLWPLYGFADRKKE